MPLTTAYGYCPNCGQYTDDRRPRTRQDGSVFYRTSCRTCDNAMIREQRARRRSVPRIPVTSLGSARQFGIEIECNYPGGYYGAEGGTSPLEAALPSGWEVRTDGSLGYEGIEVVSPPISGPEGFDQVKTVCQILRTRGATISRRCGFHVHYDVSDVGVRGLARFARSWTENHHLLNYLVSPSRRRNTFCRQLNTLELDRIDEWAEVNGSADQTEVMHRPYPLGQRYRAINVLAYPRHGTVEVRAHQGSLNYRKMETWIRLGQKMLDKIATEGAPIERHETLVSLFESIELDTRDSRYLIGRARAFGASEIVATGAPPPPEPEPEPEVPAAVEQAVSDLVNLEGWRR